MPRVRGLQRLGTSDVFRRKLGGITIFQVEREVLGGEQHMITDSKLSIAAGLVSVFTLAFLSAVEGVLGTCER